MKTHLYLLGIFIINFNALRNPSLPDLNYSKRYSLTLLFSEYFSYVQESRFVRAIGDMLVCSCNIITESDIKSVIEDMLRQDPWQLIVPVQVYHEMGKRGRCCGCFPRLVDLIVETSEAFHRNLNSEEDKIVQFICNLKQKHHQCETARMLARHRLSKIRAA